MSKKLPSEGMKRNYKEEIKARGLKMQYVAEQIGVSNVWLSKCLKSPNDMTTCVRIKLEKFLDN